MLELTVTLSESFNEETQEFIANTVTLELEHSLLVLSKWESKNEKLFLTPEPKTGEEILSYVECMIMTPDYPPEALMAIARDEKALKQINEYLNAKMSGSTVPDVKDGPKTRERISSELIYYWMSAAQIPWVAETWHLSRLFMLIKIYAAKNQQQNAPKTKMGQREAMAARKAENDRRLAQYQTSG